MAQCAGDRHAEQPAVEHKDVQQITDHVHHTAGDTGKLGSERVAVQLQDRCEDHEHDEARGAQEQTAQIGGREREQLFTGAGSAEQGGKASGEADACQSQKTRQEDAESDGQGEDAGELFPVAPADGPGTEIGAAHHQDAADDGRNAVVRRAEAAGGQGGPAQIAAGQDPVDNGCHGTGELRDQHGQHRFLKQGPRDRALRICILLYVHRSPPVGIMMGLPKLSGNGISVP